MRTALTTLAVVFGVAVIFGLNSMLPTVTEAFNRSMLATAGQVDLTITSASGATFEPSIAEKVARTPGVRAVTPTLRRPVAMPRGGPVPSITVVGIVPRSATAVRPYPLASGRMLFAGDRGVVVLPSMVASKLGVRVGSHLRLPTVNGTQTYAVVGLLDTVSVPGAEEAFMTLPDAQRLFGEGNRISELDASFAAGVDRKFTEDRIARVVGSEYSVGGLSNQSQLLASLQIGQFIMNMFGVFALAMGGFIILNTFRTVVAERRHDIGMLRAIGASRRTILNIFLIESVLQGVLGTAVGLVVGFGIGWGVVALVNPLYEKILNMTIGSPKFEMSALVAAVVLGIGVTVLSALAPAFQAARITPLEALRPQIGDVEERRRGRRAWIGAGLLLASAVMLLSAQSSAVGLGSVGVLVGLILVAPELVGPISFAFSRVTDLVFPSEGEIARSNMQRQPSRAATTAAAVMISLSIIIALIGVLSSVFTAFISYVDKSIGRADFVLLPTDFLLAGGNIGASDKLVNQIRDTPGIGAVATLRITLAQADGQSVQVIGIDPVDYPKLATFEFVEGGATSDIAKLAEGRTVIANGLYASRVGLHPGSYVKVTTANGEKPYRVVAVGSDYLNAKLATVYISQDQLKNDFGTETNAAVLANLKPGAGSAEVQRHLNKLVADYPTLTLYDTTQFRRMQETTFAQSMVMMYALIAILAIPSLLALLNNLAMSVIARTREIGMLRAVGSTRGQIRRMVLAESLLLASVGVTFGVISGVALGYALVLAMSAVGFPTPYTFPTGGIVAGVAIGYVFAVVAALLPARNAARLDIVTALHYE
jgi:putative ABC transport system permease protein